MIRYLHVVYTLVAEKSKSFVQQLLCKGIIVLVACPPCLVKHAFSESVMSAETKRISSQNYILLLLLLLIFIYFFTRRLKKKVKSREFTVGSVSSNYDDQNILL